MSLRLQRFLVVAVGCIAAVGGLGLAVGASCNKDQPLDVEEQCEACHARTDETSIEDAHPAFHLTCTQCHGGNPDTANKDAAHVAGPEGVESIRAMAADELDAIDPEYLRFVNPGDIRVADVGCGAGNAAAGETSCHQGLVETVSRSVMSTFVGHYNVPRYLAGLQGHEAQFGSRDLAHDEFDAAVAPEGAVAAIHAMRPPPPEADPTSMATLMDHYLVKSCPTCHAYSFGPNNSPGNYRSSGCTACHMLYDNDGLSLSKDPHVDKQAPPHPVRHELTTAIPETQCEHCHYQGARIGLMFQGIREGGFADDPALTQGIPLGEPRHAHGADFYFVDEDASNDVDETPGDLHWQAGLTCVDCHQGTDVHGDGWMYSTAKYQVGIRCEDCHGTVRSVIAHDSDGNYRNSKGSVLKGLRRNENGVIVLVGRIDGREHVVKQIKEVLDTGSNPRMVEAMAPDPDTGFSHTDTMECYACHTGQRQNCFGCHVEVDMGFEMRDHQTGQVTRGLVQGKRDWYDLDTYLLGTNNRGKVTSVCPSQQVFITYIDEAGNKVINEKVRTTASGRLGFGWQPNNQHTVVKVPQNCDRCHIRPDGSNEADVRKAYGFGSGEYMLSDGDGVEYDLLKILEEDGTPLVDFGHANTGAVSMEQIERALAIRVEPQPR